ELSLDHHFLKEKSKELLDIILCKARQILESTFIDLFVVSPNKKTLRVSSSKSQSGVNLPTVDVDISKGAPGLAIVTKGAVIANAPVQGAYFDPQHDVFVDTFSCSDVELQNILAVPILSTEMGEVLAVIQFVNRLNGGDFSEDDRDRVIVLIRVLGGVLEDSVELIGMGFFGRLWRESQNF
ncbi:MAG: hypothetical protein ACFCBU_00015, partial [Cyanophyceae cyanobacterium]